MDSEEISAFPLMDEVRDRLNRSLRFDAHERDGDFLYNPDYEDWVIQNAKTDAAVLIGFVERHNGVCVILTKRAEQLSSHSGQVAFPGGKIDAGDANAEATALREAQEEIGLDPDEVSVIGRLPDYYTGSQFRVAPILAEVSPQAGFEINADEVDYLFEVPLAFLMNPENHHRSSRVFQGTERHFLEMPYGEHRIWGVTAGIIRVLHDRVFAP